jgi:hypothetical protein
MLTDVDVLEPTHLTFESVVADSVNLRSNKLIKDMYTHSVDLDVIKELESLVVEYNEREEPVWMESQTCHCEEGFCRN